MNKFTAAVLLQVVGVCGGLSAVDGEWNGNGPVPDRVLREAKVLRDRFLRDEQRPYYHFRVVESPANPGDPNGAFWHNGRCHLMYLYERAGTGAFCWGHVSSADFLHWRHHPDAIAWTGDVCCSGGAFRDDDGTVYLAYSMVREGRPGIGLVKSTDATLDSWEPLPDNPRIVSNDSFGIQRVTTVGGRTERVATADPSNIWKHNGKYYLVCGNLPLLNAYGRRKNASSELRGDHLSLFESDDLMTWRYLHPFYERRANETAETGWTDDCEDNMCPSFLPLPTRMEGGAASDSYLLLFISHIRGCQYYIGKYGDNRFLPESHGRMSWADKLFFAPEAMIDGKGRQILWAWLEGDPADARSRGWSGVYGLPRVLWLREDRTLGQAPVPELEMLRINGKSWNGLNLQSGERMPLTGFPGDCCEIELIVDAGSAGNFELEVRASADGQEKTCVGYDPARQELYVDARSSGSSGWTVLERAPLALADGETLSLRVYVDRVVVEAFANRRQAMTRRVFPSGGESSCGVYLTAKRGAVAATVHAWEIMPTNPY